MSIVFFQSKDVAAGIAEPANFRTLRLHEENGAMTRKTLPVALGFTLLLFASGAQAGAGDYAGNGLGSSQRLSPVERTQYSSSGSGNPGDDSDCWDLYQTDCPIPHETNPIQDLAGRAGYPGALNRVYRGGAPAAGLSSGGAHVYPGGVPALHDFSGAGAGLHGLGSAGVPASPGFMADAPAFHGFEGAEGFHGFGGGSGFRGGGGAFSFGGHGGIGHR